MRKVTNSSAGIDDVLPSITKAENRPGKQYDSCPFLEAAYVDRVFRVRVVLEETVRQTAGSMSLSA
jgi:hypothetical protein